MSGFWIVALVGVAGAGVLGGIFAPENSKKRFFGGVVATVALAVIYLILVL